MMPSLAPIGETSSSTVPANKKKRLDNTIRSNRNNNGGYDGSGDDILSLLGGSEEAETDEPQSHAGNKQSSGPAAAGKKVRFAGGSAHHQPAPSQPPVPASAVERTSSSIGIIGDGSFREGSRQPQITAAMYANGGKPRSRPTTPFDPTISRPSSAVSSIFDSSSSDHGKNNDRQGEGFFADRRTANGSSFTNTSSASDHNNGQMEIEILKRRHQDEIDAIVAKHGDELDRVNQQQKEVDSSMTTLSSVVGPVVESANLLQSMQIEWKDRQENDAGLLKDAVATLHSVATDLQSQQQAARDELGAERSRLESLQVSLQREREQLLQYEDSERTQLMSRLESLESERLEHAQSFRKQQSELQKSRDDLERGKLEFAIRVQDIEDKLERKREALARDKEVLIDSKEKLAQERADFDESVRMARTELQGADASRREMEQMQSSINTEASRLNTLKEQLEQETKVLLEREASIDAKLRQAQQLEAQNAQTLNDIEKQRAEQDRSSARLNEREERLLYSSIDAMKSRYNLQQQQQQYAVSGSASATHQQQQQQQQHQYYSAAEYYGGGPTLPAYPGSTYRPNYLYPPLSPNNYMNITTKLHNASAKKTPRKNK